MLDNNHTAPWTDRALDPDQRARLLATAMTLDEKIRIVHGPMGRPRMGLAAPERALGSAGFVPGVPRLGIPDLQETDASVGVTNPDNCRPGDGATALPATLAVAAAWDTGLAARGGAVLGNESRNKGFNVMLAGGVNLSREPRNGRNFEYFGEDPLLTGVLAGHAIRGIQGERVVSTIKHFALNNQETGRFSADVLIDEAAARESDLLAFELALEIGQPGSVMCGYNLVNGKYCSESEWLMNDVLKKAWGYPGWVMSDWGAVRSVDAALAGLDQQSGDQLDKEVYFGAPLQALAQSDPRYGARLDDMVHRILRSLFATGLMDDPVRPGGAIDYAAHAEVARQTAEQGIVMLKNAANVLPLRAPARVAIIGGMAEFGVLAGGGSSYVTAVEGPGIQTPAMGVSAVGVPRMMIYHPSSPYQALRRALPATEFLLSDGAYPKAAAQVAAAADIAVVFATQWTTESIDVPDLSLPHGQDALIAAVAAANPRTVVVLETGGPVLMPWLGEVAAVLEAWYAGGQGGVAIANVLAGVVDPVGRLPLTFPASEKQLPRPVLAGIGQSAYDAANAKAVFPLPYEEGADIGYRWFARHGLQPLFPFGFGLTYTRFEYRDAGAAWDTTARVAFTVANVGERAGTEVAQVYLAAINGVPEQRLAGWAKVRLAPGAAERCEVVIDRRLLARFDSGRQCWRIDAGDYAFTVSRDAADAGTPVQLAIPRTEYFT